MVKYSLGKWRFETNFAAVKNIVGLLSDMRLARVLFDWVGFVWDGLAFFDQFKQDFNAA